MSDEAGDIPGGEAVSYPIESNEPMSLEDAVRDLGAAREKALNPAAESAPPATAETKLSDEDNAAPLEEATGETEEDAPAQEPPRDLPRSWTKDRTEHWAKLDPATQDFLLEQDRKASAEVRRVQNEAAEKLKGLTAKEQEVERVRQQYESKLSNTVKAHEDALQAEFGDIQTMQDVRKLQAEDPFRFQAWQVRQMELTAAKSDQLAAEQRQTQEKQGKRASYEAQENARLIELVPEMADPKKASELRERAVAMLTDDLGLKNEVLTRWMADDTGHEILSNAGFQKLIADGLKYRDIQNAPKAVASKTLPPVQRPGTARPASSSSASQIQALEKQLSSASGDKAARISAEIWRLEKRAAAR
jgi:hypothetical protein